MFKFKRYYNPTNKHTTLFLQLGRVVLEWDSNYGFKVLHPCRII